MSDSRIKIGDGQINDFFKEFGFIYLDADERTEAPIKTRDATSYAEKAGEHVDPRTVQDAFDYTAKFLIECHNRNFENANTKIANFNKALYEQEKDSDIRTYKEIEFYNLHNRVKIVGLPDPIAEPTDFYRRSDGSAMDCVMVELKIHVNDPTKCEFDMLNNQEDMIALRLETDGKQIKAITSRPLVNGEHICLLSVGYARSQKHNVIDGKQVATHTPSKLRWHVRQKRTGPGRGPFDWLTLAENNVIEHQNGTDMRQLLCLPKNPPRQSYNYGMTFSVRKSSNKRYHYRWRKGSKGKICYAFAVYAGAGRNKRISNVVYFRVNFYVEDPTKYPEGLNQWISI